jgi:hypothetical protein
MPNLISNRLEITGLPEHIDAVVDFICGEPNEKGFIQEIDFNKISPIPEELAIADCSNARAMHQLLFSENYTKEEIGSNREHLSRLSVEEQKGALDLALLYERNIKKYNHKTCFTWCIENWGTKWNALMPETQPEVPPNIIEFFTAWSPPVEAIRKLSSLFGDVTLTLDFYNPADLTSDYDSIGNGFGGKVEMKNGEILLETVSAL